MARVSIVVPSFRRPESLMRCLEGLVSQTERDFELVPVIRPSDRRTLDVLESFRGRLRLMRIARVDQEGYAPAIASGLAGAKCSIVALLDDDARPEDCWVEKILRHFNSISHLGAIGGRIANVMPDGTVTGRPFHPNGRVARVTYLGRPLSRLHDIPDVPILQEVDFLPGSNVAFRRDLVAIDPNLYHGRMAPSFELDLCFGIKKCGLKVMYSSDLVVTHYPASRAAGLYERRDRIAYSQDYGYTFMYVVLKNVGLIRKIFFFLHFFLVGHRASPGVCSIPLYLLREGGIEWVMGATKAKLKACGVYLRTLAVQSK